MENKIIENIFIKEENYQRVKKFLNKNNDYFFKKEIENFNAVLMQRHE